MLRWYRLMPFRTTNVQALHGTLGDELLTAGLRAKPVERDLQRGDPPFKQRMEEFRALLPDQAPVLAPHADGSNPAFVPRHAHSRVQRNIRLRCGKVGEQGAVRHDDRRAAS
jgi:hypothetical protein